MIFFRRVGIILLAITIITSSNLIFNDNADYYKASAASGVEEFLTSSMFEYINVDNRYTYFVRSKNMWSDSTEIFWGLDNNGNVVWKFDGAFAQVPQNMGISQLKIASKGGGGLAAITRRINDSKDPLYNPANIFEFVDFSNHTNLNFYNYSYFVLKSASMSSFKGLNDLGLEVWRTEHTSSNIQIPEDKNIHSISASGFDGDSIFVIVRKLKNSSPNLNLLTPNNHVLSDVQGHNIYEIEGFIQDPDNDNVTITATIDGKSKSVQVNNTATSKLFKIKFDVIADKLSKGKHTVTVTANDGKGGISSKNLTVTIITFAENNKYVLIDELLMYLTKYNDPENDRMLKEQFMYEHDPLFFENNLGKIEDSGIWKGLPLETSPIRAHYDTLTRTGHYKVYYRAMDNPHSDTRFSEFDKWSPPTPALNLYVHRKPVPEFSFTMNKTTRAYTVTNQAYDLDKYSMNIGKGPGIQSQKFEWRQKGQTAWNPDLPPSPLSLVVYEVKNTVVDFQNREESKIKELDATGLNKPPVANFEPIPSVIRTSMDTMLRNNSYDPNGDNMTSRWYWKVKGQDDTKYVEFATGGSWTNNTPNANWNPTKNFIAEGEYTFRLVVTDQFGLSDSTTGDVTVLSSNSAPIACMQIPTPNYIGDTITIKNCASDPEGQPLGISYLVEKPNGALLVYAQGDSNVLNNGDLILTFNSHPEDLGKWTITQFVTDGFLDASSTGNLDVLNQTVKGKVYHTEQWLKNIQKYNLQYPSKAFKLDPSNGLVEFFKGERFLLETEPTRRAANIKVTIVEHPIYNTNLTLNNGDIWKGDLWAEEMYFKFKDKEELSFLFEATFQNGWKATDTVKVKIRDENYWTQHTAY